MEQENVAGKGLGKASEIDALLKEGFSPGDVNRNGCAWRIAVAILTNARADWMVHSQLMSSAPLQQKFWGDLEAELPLASEESRERLLLAFCRGWRGWEMDGALMPEEQERHQKMFGVLSSGMDAGKVLAKGLPRGKKADWWVVPELKERSLSAKESTDLGKLVKAKPPGKKGGI